MSVFEFEDFENHEHVNFFTDEETGLKAVIAIHNTALGPAMGGCRMRPYKNEQEAIKDALRLSSGMSRKAAIAKVPFGGGKTVVWGNPEKDKSRGLLLALGRVIKAFEDRYYTGEDMGMDNEDFLIVGEIAPNLVGVDKTGKLTSSGAITAYGVLYAMQAAMAQETGGDSLSGKTVAIQGLGHVGLKLVELLTEEGAKTIVSDINEKAVKKAVENWGAKAVGTDAILFQDCDLLSPCAMGGILTGEMVKKLKCGMIVGAANNQLADLTIADRLAERGIVYLPDYVANQGGLIRVAHEGMARLENRPYSEDEVMDYLKNIPDTVTEVLRRAREEGVTPLIAAERIARQRIEAAEARRGS